MKKNIFFVSLMGCLILPLASCNTKFFTKTPAAPENTSDMVQAVAPVPSDNNVKSPATSQNIKENTPEKVSQEKRSERETTAKAMQNSQSANVKKDNKNAENQIKGGNSVMTQTRESLPVSMSVLSGEWIIKKVGTTVIDREEDYPYINLVFDDNSFYASNGCNVLNGSFSIDGSCLTFHNVLATMRYCPDTPFDTEINAVIADEKTLNIRLEVNDGMEIMYFTDSHGRELMLLQKPGLDFLNGNWQVTSIEGEGYDNSEMTIFFDIEERRVHGNTGCNSFNGDLIIDPQNPLQFSLSNMAVTMRLCPNIEQQSKFLVALERTSGAALVNKDAVNLTDSEGNILITLRSK